jgi:hypothetical protein
MDAGSSDGDNSSGEEGESSDESSAAVALSADDTGSSDGEFSSGEEGESSGTEDDVSVESVESAESDGAASSGEEGESSGEESVDEDSVESDGAASSGEEGESSEGEESVEEDSVDSVESDGAASSGEEGESSASVSDGDSADAGSSDGANSSGEEGESSDEEVALFTKKGKKMHRKEKASSSYLNLVSDYGMGAIKDMYSFKEAIVYSTAIFMMMLGFAYMSVKSDEKKKTVAFVPDQENKKEVKKVLKKIMTDNNAKVSLM